MLLPKALWLLPKTSIVQFEVALLTHRQLLSLAYKQNMNNLNVGRLYLTISRCPKLQLIYRQDTDNNQASRIFENTFYLNHGKKQQLTRLHYHLHIESIAKTDTQSWAPRMLLLLIKTIIEMMTNINIFLPSWCYYSLRPIDPSWFFGKNGIFQLIHTQVV